MISINFIITVFSLSLLQYYYYRYIYYHCFLSDYHYSQNYFYCQYTSYYGNVVNIDISIVVSLSLSFLYLSYLELKSLYYPHYTAVIFIIIIIIVDVITDTVKNIMTFRIVITSNDVISIVIHQYSLWISFYCYHIYILSKLSRITVQISPFAFDNIFFCLLFLLLCLLLSHLRPCPRLSIFFSCKL